MKLRTFPFQSPVGVAPAVAFAASPLAVAEFVDFDAVELQSVPTGWLVAMTHEGAPPRWQIVQDASSRGASRVLAQVSTDATSQRFPLAIVASPALKNGELKVRFKPVAGRVDQAAGVVWRYRDANNYYLVRANALEGNVVLYKVQNGERTTLAPIGREGRYGTEHPVPSGAWSTLGVAFDGSRFTVLFDGKELFQVEDRTFMEAGKVGVWTKADSVTYFDDFEWLPKGEAQ